ncbi:ABC transporter substrate-binding protein, partial [Verminephrobacter sp. Larva24]
MTLVLLPGAGKVVKGARRWLTLGPVSFQPSELAKLAMLLYAAGYMVRKMEVKERFFRAVLPMACAVAIVGVLLLAEPDMGAFIVVAMIAMGILFLGGVNARMFLLIVAVLLAAFLLMIANSPWRRERVFAYLDPFGEEHAQGKGYQLSHALIAIGRGEIFGVGLGGSVEKLHWLPEAHTDFLLAVIGVEDSGYDPKRAVLAAQKLVNQDKIFIMIGHIGTAQNLAAMPVQFSKNVINFLPLTGAREMYEPWHRLKYSFFVPYYDQIRLAVPRLIKEKNARKICTIYQDDEFGLEVMRGGAAALKTLGLEFTEKTTYKRGATDFSSQVAKMKSAGCDLVILGT